VAGEPPPRRDAGYRVARIGTAAALTSLLVFLLILDALSADYSLSEVTLTALLATILTLLGIEATSILGRRQP
jgi:hypothetical protein